MYAALFLVLYLLGMLLALGARAAAGQRSERK